MHGNWVVQMEDGPHHVYAETITGFTTNTLKVTWDGEVIESSSFFWVLGDLKSFQRGDHSFTISIRGFGRLGKLVLSMDGNKVSTGPGPGPEPPPPQAPVQFLREVNVQESEEIVGIEEYPLDNRFGDKDVSTVHQVSRESTNELSIDTSKQLSGKVGLDVLSAIKAEIEAQVSRQTGHKIGLKVTESQSLNLSVGPKSSVLYKVVWKRKVLSGERLYSSGGKTLTVPYRISYGLSCEVRTQAKKDDE